MASSNIPKPVEYRQLNTWHTPPEFSGFVDKVKKHAAAVFRIWDGEQAVGSGCLIGGNLLLTCYHVIPTREKAAKMVAQLFCATDVVGSKEYLERTSVKIDPELGFYQSKNRGIPSYPLSANKGEYDFTIVGLELSSTLTKIQGASLSIFSEQNNSNPVHGTPVCILHHPSGEDLKITPDKILQDRTYDYCYGMKAVGGSSGAPVIDSSGRLIALHYQSKKSSKELACGCDPSDHPHTFGVKISKIVAYIEQRGWRADIEAKIPETRKTLLEQFPAPVDDPKLQSTQSQIFDVPAPSPRFTGRKSELNELHSLCKSSRRVAITGLGGIGKTALAVEYAHQNKKCFDYIYFIPSSTKQALTTHLLELADVLKIPANSDSDQRLKALKQKLNTLNKLYLLIFDNLDSPELFSYLNNYLPTQGKGQCLILTSRMPEQTHNLKCQNLELKPLQLDDAAAYLLETTTSSDAESAKALAKALGCLPLALTHASAYIRSSGISISEYLAQYNKYQLELFTPKNLGLNTNRTLIDTVTEAFPLAKTIFDLFSYLTQRTEKPLDDSEKTILTTWTISLNAINKQSPLATSVLAFFSFLAQDPIPLISIKHWLSKTYPEQTELELNNALRALKNYSMINAHQSNYTIHTLVQAVTRRTLKNPIQTCCQALSTFSDLIGFYNSAKPEYWSFVRSIIPHCETLNVHRKVHSLESTEPVIDLLLQLGTYCQTQSRLSDGASYYKQVLELESINQKQTAQALHNLGMVLQEQGKLVEAQQYFGKVLEIETEVYGTRRHPEVAKTTHQLGRVLQEQGKLVEAQQHFSEVLEIFTEVYGTRRHPEVAKTIHQLGIVLELQGKLVEAQQHFSEVLEIFTEVYGTRRHPSVATTIHQLGIVLQLQGKLVEAQQHFSEVLEIETEVYGTRRHPSVAKTIHQLGIVLQLQGKLVEAQQHFSEVLEIFTEVYGTRRHPSVATTIHQLGRVLQLQGKLVEAQQHFSEVLEIETEVYGTRRHPSVAKTIHQLGIVLQLQGKLVEAQQHFSEVLEIFTEVYGTRRHPLVATTIHQLGIVLQLQGKLVEAQQHFSEVLEIETEVYGTRRHPSVAKTIHQLGIVLQLQGKLVEAQQHFSEVLEIETEVYGTRRHPSVAKTIHQLGIVLQLQGKLVEAQQHFSEVLEIFTEVYRTRRHPEVATTIHQLGRVLQEQGKLVEAQQHYSEVLEIFTEVYRTRRHPSLATTIHQLGIVLQLQGKLVEAQQHFSEVLEIETEVYGTRRHPSVAKTIHQLGIVLRLQGKLVEAQQHYSEVLEIKTEVYGTRRHPSVAKTLFAIGLIFAQQGKVFEAKPYIQESVEIAQHFGLHQMVEGGKQLLSQLSTPDIAEPTS